MAVPRAKGSQEHLGASRGIRKPLETGKVLGEGSKTYFIYVLRPSILKQRKRGVAQTKQGVRGPDKQPRKRPLPGLRRNRASVGTKQCLWTFEILYESLFC